MDSLVPPTLDEIRAAATRLDGRVTASPLVHLDGTTSPEIHLKLENLQPIGSFKLRGATNAILSADERELADGVTTASAGNMAQGVAFVARQLGLPCRVILPDHAPRAKRDAITRLGGELFPVPFEEWWEIMLGARHDATRGRFVHPVCDPAVVAGNGTLGLEISAELPDVDAVVAPFGGGGLSSGIAAALRELRPRARVHAAEVSTAAPLSAALAAGQPVPVEYTPSFVDGIGGKGVLPPMWPMVRELLAGSIVCELEAVAEALRVLLTKAHVVAEGAGAAAVAAARTGRAGTGKVVCIVSGGNIDRAKLVEILHGRVPA